MENCLNQSFRGSETTEESLKKVKGIPRYARNDEKKKARNDEKKARNDEEKSLRMT